ADRRRRRPPLCPYTPLFRPLDGTGDDAVGAALAEARDRGAVAFASAGNTVFGPRGGVDYPASDPTVLAVSAMGRRGSFPDGTLEDRKSTRLNSSHDQFSYAV